MRLGTDIIEIDRIKEAVEKQEKFVEKILTPDELQIYQQYSGQRQMEFLAGRFCAKEAYVKALNTGIGKIKFTDISILYNDKGAPIVAQGPIIQGVVVSISHCRTFATATVIVDLPEFVVCADLKKFFE